MCVGFTFAQVELRAIIINLIQKYTITLADPAEKGSRMIEAGVSQPEKKFKLRFTLRP